MDSKNFVDEFNIASNSEEFIDYVAPKYAIITSGKSDTEDQEILDIMIQLFHQAQLFQQLLLVQ